jgi:hypothetical protein
MNQDHSQQPGHWYTKLAILVLNTLIALVLVNVLLGLFYLIKDRNQPQPQPDILEKYDLEELLAAYPGWEENQLEAMLIENWNRPIRCNAPFVVFQMEPFTGDYVNISEEGYRHVENQGPWPPPEDAYVVFVFGGSTTFGSGLPDWQTVPSYLQSHLGETLDQPVYVYNFGCPFYVSRQEAALFKDLVYLGYTPDAAVFINGLNDAIAGGGLNNGQCMVAARNEDSPAESWLPMARAANSIRYRLDQQSNNEKPDASLIGDQHRPEFSNSEERTQAVLNQWQLNKEDIELVAGAYDIQTLFVWQPVPAYQYDLSAHLLYQDINDLPFGTTVREVYQAMDRTIRDWGLCTEETRNILYLADIQAERDENLYVDAYHYSAAFAEEIAGHIAQRLLDPAPTCE